MKNIYESCDLGSALEWRNLDSIISLDFKTLASLCSWAGRFESYWSKTLKTGFLVTRLKPYWSNFIIFTVLPYYGPKFSDRQVWANSVDPDQSHHCLTFRLHRMDTFKYGNPYFEVLLSDEKH